eukprot:15356039-Ditylum_brightwellii.AAC.1
MDCIVADDDAVVYNVFDYIIVVDDDCDAVQYIVVGYIVVADDDVVVDYIVVDYIIVFGDDDDDAVDNITIDDDDAI